MNTTIHKIILHLILMGGITILIVLCMVYPFLPGRYDGLAMGLSTTAQTFGIVGLAFVPIGVLWFAYELWGQARNKPNLPEKKGGYYFAFVAVIVASLVIVAISIAGTASVGLSFGLLTLALWFYSVSRLMPRIKSLKNALYEGFNFTCLYLIVIPIAALLFQLMLAAPITQASRDHAIAMSTELINDIEEYRAANGYYPSSLLATWPDYSPDVVGIEQFHYAPQGDAYNLFFEQPRFLLDDLGAREFVVYNPLDEHTMISHASWILLLSPGELRVSQGWYAVRDASTPHWKSLWFD
jgi:hypothetical protein